MDYYVKTMMQKAHSIQMKVEDPNDYTRGAGRKGKSKSMEMKGRERSVSIQDFLKNNQANLSRNKEMLDGLNDFDGAVSLFQRGRKLRRDRDDF